MAEGILGLAGGGAASLNQELIDKLKDAERSATVAPIETSIENITGEGGESEKLAEIVAKANELLETIKPFDLFVSGGVTAFDQKTANVTGTSAIFDAVDASAINEGTTTVSIQQLAQRDVFQTNTFSDATAIVSPVSFVIDGETFTTDSEDFSALAGKINDSATFTASLSSDILMINKGAGDITFDTAGKTYNELAREIDSHLTGNFTSSVPNTMMVLSQSSRPVYQSDEKITADKLVQAGTLTIEGIDFVLDGSEKYSSLVSDINANENFSARITNLGRLEITHSDKETVLTISGTPATAIGLGSVLGEKYSTAGVSYEDLAKNINTNSNYTSTVESVGPNTNRIVIKSVESGLDNSINITQLNSDLGFNQYSSTASIIGTDDPADGQDLTINGVTFTTLASENYDTFVGRINDHADFNASISNGKIFLSREDGSDISVTTDDLSLGFVQNNDNHTVNAQNLEATVDGIDYDVSSNVLIVDGGLKITAVEENEVGKFSTISVQKDTTTIEPTLQSFVTKYNELVSLIDDELFSSDSNIEDKSTLRTMMNSIKDTMFSSYGENSDLNIFNYGFEIDKNGILSLDSAKFNEAVEENPDELKSLFVGVAETRGLGTQLKEYVDNLDSFQGLLTTYETNMNTRKDALEEDKTKAIESLDSKYSLLAQQFAAYSTIINQFEAQFSGLKLMIQQSVATN